jgi:TolB-like protein/Flp pilus assembly protein TadD
MVYAKMAKNAHGRAFRYRSQCMGNRGFWQELKRRHVYRVAVAYAVVGWLLVQIVTQVFPVFHLPDWIDQAVVLLILVGFPIALVLAWAFDATPRGVVRTGASPDGTGESPTRSRHAGIAVGLLGVSIAVIAGGVYWHFGRAGAHARVRTLAAAAAVSAPTASGAVPATSGAASSGNVAPIVAQPIPAKSIAVLPFENLSIDKGNAYFADGMQDLILTKLADIGDLKVISRTSTEKYKSHPDDLRTIGQQLGVAAILEGSVQKAGNDVLINVQLIDAKTDGHVWAQSYQRTLHNIFGVEGEVAQKVADALKAKLTAEETAAVARIPTTNAQAYTLYLKARYLMDQLFTVYGAAQTALAEKAAPDLEQAITLDPKFAAAYAELARVELVLANSGLKVTKQTAMTHARKALALQSDLASGHAILGTLLWQKGDFTEGMQEMQEAARLAPNDANIAYGLVGAYMSMGAWQQADAAARKAVSLNPRSGVNYDTAAYVNVLLRRYPDARQMLERGLAVDPDDMRLHLHLGGLLELLGDLAGARAQYAQLPEDPYFDRFARLSVAWRRSRNCTEGLKAARQMPLPPRRQSKPVRARY